MDLESWLRERVLNCERIAGEKAGDIADGWREDANYYRSAIVVCVALAESVKLQSHYAELLNAFDGGHRLRRLRWLFFVRP